MKFRYNLLFGILLFAVGLMVYQPAMMAQCTGPMSIVMTGASSGNVFTTTAVALDVACFNGTDGQITVTPLGGTPTFSYSLCAGAGCTNFGTTQTSNQFSGLAPGTYTVMVSDMSGCSKTTTVVVNEPAEIPLPPGILTAEDLTNGNCAIGNPGGVPFGTAAPIIANNNCVPPAAAIFNILPGGNNGTISTTNLDLRASCGITPYNNHPLFYIVECDPNGGQLNVVVDVPMPVSGTMTQMQALLYGPFNAPCPDLSLDMTIDCEEDTDVSDGATIVLTANNTGAGDLYLLIIDTQGTGLVSVQSAPSSALPIELLSFTGEIQGKRNALKWITATEMNTNRFVVERSTNGADFQYIGEVAAAGNSVTQRVYTFNDEEPPIRAYYRLRVIDNDATQQFSNTVYLARTKGDFGIANVYPVPTTDNVNVEFETTKDNVTINMQLIDVLGRVLAVQNVTVDKGLHRQTFSLKEYAAAVYMITIDDGKHRITRRVIKE